MIYPVLQGFSHETAGITVFSKLHTVRRGTLGVLKHHVPIIKGMVGSQAKASVDMLIEQVGALSQQLTYDKSVLNGPVIYLAGLSLLEESEYGGNLPSSKFIPWYLLINESKSVKRIYRQPELALLFQKMHITKPRIEDLESMIAEMEGGANYD
ncbi:MAG: hypothetical protein NV67_11605 [Gammaproteobacteria bacterium (ex Lamellibrachia satsuma)]|nr:MAG: hypothetical protein NV67_11605 [Gammaproteobacteria bacterium (ex Lamellibrachia satsuma)]